MAPVDRTEWSITRNDQIYQAVEGISTAQLSPSSSTSSFNKQQLSTTATTKGGSFFVTFRYTIYFQKDHQYYTWKGHEAQSSRNVGHSLLTFLRRVFSNLPSDSRKIMNNPESTKLWPRILHIHQNGKCVVQAPKKLVIQQLNGDSNCYWDHYRIIINDFLLLFGSLLPLFCTNRMVSDRY